jgi:hypothetical protein
VKENPMTIENDALCEDLRAWMKSPPMGLPEYSSQSSVALAECLRTSVRSFRLSPQNN